MTFIIETARLGMREFHADDAEDFFALCTNPEVMRYVGDGYDGPFTLDAAISLALIGCTASGRATERSLDSALCYITSSTS